MQSFGLILAPHLFFESVKKAHSLWELPVFSALFRNLISNASLVWTQSIAVSLQGLSSALFLTVHRDGGLSPICIPGPRSCWIEPRYILLCEDVSNSFLQQTPLRGSRGFGFVLESPSTRCRPHTASVNWMFTVRVFSKPQCQDL